MRTIVSKNDKFELLKTIDRRIEHNHNNIKSKLDKVSEDLLDTIQERISKIKYYKSFWNWLKVTFFADQGFSKKDILPKAQLHMLPPIHHVKEFIINNLTKEYWYIRDYLPAYTINWWNCNIAIVSNPLFNIIKENQKLLDLAMKVDRENYRYILNDDETEFVFGETHD